MDVAQAVSQRRSVREYTAEPVNKATLFELITDAVHAPSAMNEQPWRFTVVTDQGLLDRISREAKTHMLAVSKGTPGGGHFESMLGDPNFHILYHAQALIVISAPTTSRWAVEDCALAAQNLMLSAYSKGFGTCWIGFAQGWLATEAGHAALQLPASQLPVAPIIVGRPKGGMPAVPRKKPDIHWLGPQ